MNLLSISSKSDVAACRRNLNFVQPPAGGPQKKKKPIFTVPVFEIDLKKLQPPNSFRFAMHCQESAAATSSMSLFQDWKHPRTAPGFTGNQGSRDQSTVLRCVTNTLIPCNAELFAAMGKMRFNVTVLSVAHTGQARAPNKKGPGGKYLKLVESKRLFEDIKDDQSISGVRMFAFKKANSNTDRGERDEELSVDITVGQV